MAEFLMKIFIGGLFRLYFLDGPQLSYVTCHKDMEPMLIEALACIVDTQKEFELTYHGCYNVRNIRGTNRLSKHAHGRAIDLNVGRAIPLEVSQCFKKAGFIWGGDWTGETYDPMHFEMPGPSGHN